MLPDIRVVIFAVIVTFLFTAGVGFYTSARLFGDQQPNTRQEAMAPRDTGPVNRVSVTVPEAAAPAAAAPEPTAAETSAEAEHAAAPQAEAVPTETADAEAQTSETHEDAPATAEATPESPPAPSATTDTAPVTEPSATQAARFLLITPALNPSPLVAGLRRAAHGAEDVVAPPPFPPRGPATEALMVPARTPDMLNAGRQVASTPEAVETEDEDELTGTVLLPTGPIPLPRAKPSRTTHTAKPAAVTRKPARQSKPKPRRARPLIVRPAPAQSSSTFSFPFSLSNSSNNQTTPATSSVPAAPAAPFTQSR